MSVTVPGIYVTLCFDVFFIQQWEVNDVTKQYWQLIIYSNEYVLDVNSLIISLVRVKLSVPRGTHFLEI